MLLYWVGLSCLRLHGVSPLRLLRVSPLGVSPLGLCRWRVTLELLGIRINILRVGWRVSSVLTSYISVGS